MQNNLFVKLFRKNVGLKFSRKSYDMIFSGSLFASGGRQMYLSEAYILMMSELACAGGLIIMNGKGAVRSTVGLAIAFVAYTVLLGMLSS